MRLCDFEAGEDLPLFLIAGPCVIESEQLALDTAGALREITGKLSVPFIYKSSFDKANRSSGDSYRGPGLERGLHILQKVKDEIGVPVLTDVHEDTPLDEVAAVADVLQTPAFLCRQTNFIRNVAACGLPVNIKKGQFLAPWDMSQVVEKARATGNERLLVCERGASFGYNYLVSDMRALVILRETGCPWCLTPPTRYSYRAPGAGNRGGSGSLSRPWPGPRWPWAWPGYSWRPIPTRRRPSATAPIPCLCMKRGHYWNPWSNWIAVLNRIPFNVENHADTGY